MKRFRRLSFALLAVALLVDAAPAVARGPHAIKVMTRNQYIGADLTPVILAQGDEEFLKPPRLPSRRLPPTASHVAPGGSPVRCS